MSETPNARVAIIEDDNGLRRSLARLLRAAGYVPTTYVSAEAFLGETEAQAFDCLLVDVQLNGMSGIQLSEHLAVAGSAAPVVFITAHEDRESLRQVMRAPFTELLGKNEPSAKLFAAIERAIHLVRAGSRTTAE